MTALSTAYARTSRGYVTKRSFPVNAGSVIYKGGIVCLDTDGYARPGADTSGFVCAGIAYESKTGGSADGDVWVMVEFGGDFLMDATSITQAMLNTSPAMYVVDDATVDDAAGSTNKVYVGNLVQYVSTTSGWVMIPGVAGFPLASVTATAAELNKTDGVAAGGYLVTAEEFTFTETSGAGTYTATCTVPAGATLLDIIVNGVALWDNAGTVTMKVGDTDDDGFFTGVNLKATDLLAGESISFESAGGKAGAYIANSQVSPRYSATARAITGIITTSSTGGSAGRTRMTVVYAYTQTTTAATKV